MKTVHISLSLVCAMLAMAGCPTATSAEDAKPRNEPTEVARPAAARPAITWGTLKQAETAPEGTVLYLRASIISVSPPRPESAQPWTIYLSDSSGASRAVMFQNTYSGVKDTTIFQPGMKVDLFVTTQDYRKVRQLVVKEANHIRRTPGADESSAFSFGRMANQTATFMPMTIGAINMTTVGQQIRVRGTAASLTEPPRERVPWRLVVKDQSGQIEVVYWKEAADSIAEAERPVVGEMIEVSGVVSEHQGKMQLRVDDGAMIRRNFTQVARGTGEETKTAVSLREDNSAQQ